MKRTWIAALSLGVLLTLSAVAQKPSTPEAQLGAIINQAEIEGKFDAAIPAYKKFLADNIKNKALAAKAQFHLGVAYEKLGNAEARKTYELVMRDYPKEPVATDARRRLASLVGSPDLGLLASHQISSTGADAISADGRFMVFEDSESEFAIRDLVTDQLMRLTATKENPGVHERIYNPLLSPDGQQVVYDWTINDTPSSNGDSQLRVISKRADSKPRILVDNREFTIFEPAAWAADSKSVLVTAWKPDQTEQLVWFSLADGSPKPLKSLDWRLRGIPRRSRPVISPDGMYIAYAALAVNPSKAGKLESTDEHIYVLRSDGTGTEIDVVKGANINESPIWMPDGKSLLFVSNRGGGSFGLWSVALQSGKATSNPVLVKPDTGRISSIGMTLSGSYYYETPFQTVGTKIFITDLDGNNVQKTGIHTPEAIIGNSPEWSPDGKSIAFLRPAKPNDQGRTNAVDTLFIYSTETGEERRYTPANTGLEAVRSSLWFHDGKSVLQTMQDSKGDKALYRVDLRSGEFKLTSLLSSKLSYISSDDKTYLAAPVGGRIVATNLNTGQERDVAAVPGHDFMILSPDDKTIYVHVG